MTADTRSRRIQTPDTAELGEAESGGGGGSGTNDLPAESLSEKKQFGLQKQTIGSLLEDPLGHRSKNSGPGTTADEGALMIDGQALMIELRATARPACLAKSLQMERS